MSIIPPNKNTVKKIRYHFSGHETFPLRYTWLPKGVQNLVEYPDLFSREDAIVILGVGKNMVTSIRHWCETLKLIESPERGFYQPTQLGQAIFGFNGWDPYLEHPGTLWLLHWLLVSRFDRASTWCLTFTRWNVNEFSRDQLADWIWQVKSESPTTRGTRASIRRDVEVFLRTYVAPKATRTRPLEETFDCPLVELGLISEIDRNRYQIIRGSQPSLPNEIFVYSLVDFWRLYNPKQNTISVEKIMHEIGSPGGAFKLTENALVERLESLPDWCQMSYGDTAGQRVVFRLKQKTIDALQILKIYYNQEYNGVDDG